jgi:hypothetical protein
MTYQPDPSLPVDVRARQEASLAEAERAAEVSRKQYEASKKSNEAARKAAEAEAARRAKEIKAEREQLAREQAARDEAEAKRMYEAAGGLPENWASFWEKKRDELIAARMKAGMSQVAHPSSYARGPAGGTSSTWTTRKA